ARRLGTKVVVVKAQIHAGGRGKGGGVKLAKSPEDAEKLAKGMLGMTLVTHQTGPEGRTVARVLIEEGLQMQRELYLSIVLDRAAGKPVVMASAAGGMDIEEVAASTPEKIAKVHIEPGVGVVPFEARLLGFAIGLDGAQVNKFVKVVTALYDAYLETDSSLVEINPLVVTAGGDPANFLDVGGGANAEQIRNAFKILMSDTNVKAVLINIFGGILRCDVLAQGVIAAVKELGVPVPIVIRMEGTNVDEGKRLL